MFPHPPHAVRCPLRASPPILAAAIAATLAASPLRAEVTGITGAHDPSTLFKDGSTYHYFITGQGIDSRRSTNLTTWSDGPAVFNAPPAWTTQAVPSFTGHFWAPDVAYFNGQYHLYYSISSWGTIDSAIGLATSPSLTSPAWTDRGKVIQSDAAWESGPNTDTTAFNAIDPNILIAPTGAVYMTWGSYSSGIVITQLDPATGKRLNPAAIGTVVANNAPNGGWGSSIEGAALIHNGAYYYLFVNYGGCCDGINSTYEIRVGRSTSPTGPFLDKNGINMLNAGGTLFYDDDGARIGPGHFARFTDAGQDYFSYHYYDGNTNGAPRFNLSSLYWTPDAWPSVAPINPDWLGASSSLWSAPANWSGGQVPGGVGSVANFLANAANRYNVLLDAPRTLSRINFRSPSSFLVGNNTGNTLTLAKMPLDAAATINVAQGSHTLAAPIVTADPLGINITPAASTLTLSSTFSGTSLTKYGHGVLSLTTLPKTFTGEVSTRAGTLRLASPATIAGNLTAGHVAGDAASIVLASGANLSVSGDINIGDSGNASTPATGTLHIQPLASLTATATGGLFIGSGFFNNARAEGTLHQSGGTVSLNNTNEGMFIIGGRTSPLANGTYNLSGGTLSTAANLRLGGYGNGTFNQSNGTFTSTAHVAIGRFAGSTGAWNISGGQLNVTNPARWLIVGESGAGTLSLSANALVSTANVIRIGHAGGNGTLHLNGGSLTTLGIQRGSGTAALHFNGGTLLPTADSAAFLQGLTSATIKAGGARFDTGLRAITIAQPLLHDAALGPTPDGGLTKLGPGTLTLGGTSTYTGTTTISQGTLLVAAPNMNFRAIAGSGHLVTQPGINTASDALSLHAFTLAGTHTLRPNAPTASQLSTLTLAGSFDNWTGRLDLTNNALVLQPADDPDKALKLATLQDQLAYARTHAAGGITSSTAAADSAHLTLALADNADLAYTTFRGQPVDHNSLLLTLATFGDANLDRKVDAFDLNLLASNWQTSNNLWSDGDFTADGLVDAFDLNLLAAHWQSGSPSLLPFELNSLTAHTAVAVPEPASLLGFAFGATLFLRRPPRCARKWGR